MNMTAEEQVWQGYATCGPVKAMDDSDLNAFLALTPEAKLAHPRLKDFLSTMKYHAGRRMTLSDTEGIVIGKRSYDEVAKDLKAKKGGRP